MNSNHNIILETLYPIFSWFSFLSFYVSALFSVFSVSIKFLLVVSFFIYLTQGPLLEFAASNNKISRIFLSALHHKQEGRKVRVGRKTCKSENFLNSTQKNVGGLLIA